MYAREKRANGDFLFLFSQITNYPSTGTPRRVLRALFAELESIPPPGLLTAAQPRAALAPTPLVVSASPSLRAVRTLLAQEQSTAFPPHVPPAPPTATVPPLPPPATAALPDSTTTRPKVAATSVRSGSERRSFASSERTRSEATIFFFFFFFPL